MGSVTRSYLGRAGEEVGLPLLAAASVCSHSAFPKAPPRPKQSTCFPPLRPAQAHHLLLSVALGFLLLILKCLNTLFPDT